MRLKATAFLALGVCVAAPHVAKAQGTESATTIGGQWFLNYRFGEVGAEDVNRFGIDRAYINIRHRLTDRITGRITPDVTLDASGDLKVRLKYAYVDYAFPDLGIFTRPHVEFGVVHRPWLDFEEHLNYYRVQGTMFIERNGIFNSADLGATIFSLIGGQMDEDYRQRVNSGYPGRYGSLAFGVYNGGGYHAVEQNVSKSFEGRLTLRPLPDVIPGLQFTYHGVIGKGNIEVDAPDWHVNLLLTSFESEHLILAGQYYWGKGNFKGTAVRANGDALPQDGYSVFAEWRFTEPRVSLLGRYDYWNDTPDVDGGESQRIIVGIAYHVKGHSQILLDFDADTRDGFDNVSTKTWKLAFEYSF